MQRRVNHLPTEGIRFKVGDVARLSRACMGNPAGTKAICYEVYRRGDLAEGWSFIFPNGAYDGFSASDCTIFGVERIGDSSLTDYEFTNVSRLWLDWKQGVFSAAFASFGEKVRP